MREVILSASYHDQDQVRLFKIIYPNSLQQLQPSPAHLMSGKFLVDIDSF